MKAELWMSLGALVISGLAYLRTVLSERRQQGVSTLERKAQLVDQMFELETGASVLYSNVLTLKESEYRQEVRDVIEKLREALPEFIEEAKRVRCDFDATGKVTDQEVLEFAPQVSEFRSRLRSIEQMLQHGLERGKEERAA